MTSGQFVALDLTGAVQPVLRTSVACPDNAQSCNVQWQILASPIAWEGIPPVVEDGFQTYDGGIQGMLEIDLSAIDGPMDITFGVLANGGQSSVDEVVFIHPRIVDAGG